MISDIFTVCWTCRFHGCLGYHYDDVATWRVMSTCRVHQIKVSYTLNQPRTDPLNFSKTAESQFLQIMTIGFKSMVRIVPDLKFGIYWILNPVHWILNPVLLNLVFTGF